MLVPLHGHATLRQRFQESVARDALPATMLFQGPRGIGKQQLALWLGRLLLCEQTETASNPSAAPLPCGHCKACRMTGALQHPDLHWYFPRPRLKSPDPDLAAIHDDNVDGILERLENDGLYEAPAGDQALFVATIRAVVQTAVMSPAMARRKVFIIGDADRMVAQEGSDQAANAFLKLLEEPPADTTIILTSSEPGALLPTIRSRVVSVRVSPLSDAEVREFLADPVVAGQLDTGRQATEELVQFAAGAPGRLIGQDTWQASLAQARRLLEAAAASDRKSRMRVSLGQGASGARGKFSDMLDALTVLLHDRARAASRNGGDAQALGAARAIDHVERAKELANGNVNPQLVTASLLRKLAPLLQ